MTLHAAADYNGAFQWPDSQDDLLTLDTIYGLLNAVKGHDHSLDKGTPVSRVSFGQAADRPHFDEGHLYIAIDTGVFSFADGVKWRDLFTISDEAIPVSAGGTGRDTLTPHATLVGEGTDPINQVGPGPDHSLYQGHTAADPTWTTTPTVDGLTDTGPMEIDGDLDVKGDTHLEGDVVIDGTATFNGPVNGAGGVVVGSAFSLSNVPLSDSVGAHPGPIALQTWAGLVAGGTYYLIFTGMAINPDANSSNDDLTLDVGALSIVVDTHDGNNLIALSGPCVADGSGNMTFSADFHAHAPASDGGDVTGIYGHGFLVS